MNYTTYKDIPDFYDRTRSLLGVSNVSLTDIQIDIQEKAPRAEMTIKSRVDGWETLVGDKLNLLQSAVVMQTAIFSYGIVARKSIKSQQQTSLKVEYRDNKQSEFEDLQSALEGILIDINGEAFSSSVFIVT